MSDQAVTDAVTVSVDFVAGETPRNRPESGYEEGGGYVWSCSNGHSGKAVARFSIADGMANRHRRAGCKPVPTD